MLDRVTSRELAEWIAYFRLQAEEIERANRG